MHSLLYIFLRPPRKCRDRKCSRLAAPRPPSPHEYFDILRRTGNVGRNLKDKLFGLGRAPYGPIWWDAEHIKTVQAGMLNVHCHQKQRASSSCALLPSLAQMAHRLQLAGRGADHPSLCTAGMPADTASMLPLVCHVECL